MTINHQINIVNANCGKFKFLIFSRILSGTFVYFFNFLSNIVEESRNKQHLF